MQSEKSFTLFAGSSHVELAQQIANELHVKLGEVQRETFPDGEIGIQIQENVRGKDVFVLQTLARRPNHFLMELLIMVDALKRASARSISAILPYYAYARQDRKDKPRMPITAKLVADLLEKAGVTRILSMDLHTEQIQGFFNIPVDHLYARPLFIRTFKNLGFKDLIVVSPDIGSNRMARKFAEELKADLAFIDKRRIDASRTEVNAVIGNVKGRHAILVDDIGSTGVTLAKAAQACLRQGASNVSAAVTHGLFVGDSLQGSGIEQIFATDTVPKKSKLPFAVSYVPTASLFAEAIDRVVKAKSVTSLFTSD